MVLLKNSSSVRYGVPELVPPVFLKRNFLYAVVFVLSVLNVLSVAPPRVKELLRVAVVVKLSLDASKTQVP